MTLRPYDLLTLGAERVCAWAPVRTLGERHRPRIVQHLLALTSEDRLRRFGHVATDEHLERYARQIDLDRDRVFGVFDSGLALVAMAHLAFDPLREGAEFGVSVHAHLRGRGLGSALFDHAVTHARNRAVRQLVIYLARDNAAMLHIVKQAGATIRFDGPDVRAELPLPGDSLASQLQEFLGLHAGELDYRMKLQARRLGRLLPGLG
ncbi:MAG: GNAT family N-acetyltransferase [Rubrivivax sp.]|nr:GNAT family N-acetyltransferase [Rubrivivax sp.]